MVASVHHGPKVFHKAQAQPIWILIGLLLAMIIGVMMYQMVSQAGGAGTFQDMQTSIDEGQARIQVREGCSAWKSSSWAIPPSNIDKISDYAARLRLLSRTEWERRESFSKCDCAMYLLVDRSATRSDVEIVYDPELCHTWANNEAETRGIIS